MNEVASRYALALYNLALEEHQVDAYQDEVKQWAEIFKDNEEFIYVLASDFLSVKERKEMLKSTLKGINENILNFLYVIIDNRRIILINQIFDAFNSLCNEYKGIKEGIVYSVSPLKKEQLSELNEKFAKKLNRKIYLKNNIDKSLIGGVKIVLDGHIYDGSLKHHLEEMKQHLIK